MATHRIPILGWNTVPDSSGSAFFDAYDQYATNDQWDHIVLVFADTSTRDVVHGKFTVPQNYVGSANLIVTWTSQQITGDVEWDFDYRAVGGNDTESLDQTGTQEFVNSNDTAPSAVNERMEISIALTAGNFAAGDTVQFLFGRDGTDAGDTLTGTVQVFELEFEYADA